MADTALVITETRFTAAPERDERAGLLGYVSLVLNGALRLDGLTLRRRTDGRLYLAYPCRTDTAGRRHPLSHPLDDESRRQIQRQVFAELGIVEVSR